MFPDVGLNVNLNTRGAQGVTACPHIQAQRASVCLLAPALFPLQRGQPWHWDPGLREQKTRDASCTVFSEDDFCSRCLVKALPLTTLLSKHTTVCLDSDAVLLLLALWWWAATWLSQIGLGKKKNAIYAIYLLVAASFLTNSKTYTLNVWTLERLYNLSCAWEGNCIKELRPMFNRGKKWDQNYVD